MLCVDVWNENNSILGARLRLDMDAYCVVGTNARENTIVADFPMALCYLNRHLCGQ